MKSIKMLVATVMLSAATWSVAASAAPAAPDAAQVKAAHDLLASMQAEKMLRMTAGMSKYPSPAQREVVLAKVEKLTPEMVYTRLAAPVARLLSTETAVEMTHYYESSYGKRVLQQTYNGGPSLYQTDPVPTAKEKIELKKPAFQKADKAFKEVESAIHHEVFLLLSEINRK
jgi:hypothetical protein